MPYGVIHQDIFDSSLAGDYQARHLFQDMCVLADAEDNVMMDALRIAHRTRVPIEVVERGLAVLREPDPWSKSSLADGRRVTELKNQMGQVIGYHIVNRHHYKRLLSRTRRREYMRLYRQKKLSVDMADGRA
jgi:hypothetical protein